jgi:uncharacterized protein involved in type VI secretion and phage assembly
MADEAVKAGWTQKFELKPSSPPEEKVYGVCLATVINNIDCTGEARVMLLLPWLPGFTPWARIASQMAGMARGFYFIPQIGDEVLVAFNHGDVREPYVIGACWNTVDRPPALLPTDPVNKRKIRTPLGHELSFDEATQTVVLSSNTFSTLTLDPVKAEISTPMARVSVGKAGEVTITAATTLTLMAQDIQIVAGKTLTLSSSTATAVSSSGPCAVQGSVVKIN